jgi:hypothetical protein
VAELTWRVEAAQGEYFRLCGLHMTGPGARAHAQRLIDSAQWDSVTVRNGTATALVWPTTRRETAERDVAKATGRLPPI